jgi:hypothetical protein
VTGPALGRARDCWLSSSFRHCRSSRRPPPPDKPALPITRLSPVAEAAPPPPRQTTTHRSPTASDLLYVWQWSPLPTTPNPNSPLVPPSSPAPLPTNPTLTTTKFEGGGGHWHDQLRKRLSAFQSISWRQYCTATDSENLTWKLSFQIKIIFDLLVVCTPPFQLPLLVGCIKRCQ